MGTRLLAGAPLVGMALLLTVYLARIDPLRTFLLRLLVPALLALPVVLAAAGAGFLARAALARFLRATTDRDLPLEVACGLPLFGCACFLVGLASTSRAALAPLLALFAVAGLVAALRSLRDAPPLRKEPDAHPLARTLTLVALGLAACLAQLPPSTLDELVAHLAFPKTWILEGRVVQLPLSSHSYFPFGVESAALPLLALFGDRGGTAFHFVVLAAAAAGLVVAHGWLRERTGARASIAVACLATTPALLLVAGAGWVDAPLAGIAVALCASLDRAVDARDDRHLAAAALAVAAGTATKYTFLPLAACALVAAAVVRRREPRALGRLALAAGAGFALGATFLLRNLAWTGNPVAPFLEATPLHVAHFNAGGDVTSLLLNYLFDPVMADESLGVALPAMALAFVVVAPALRAAPFAAWLGAATLVPLAALVALGAAGRLVAPFVAIVALAAWIGLSRILDGGAPALGRLTDGAVLLLAGTQLAYAVTLAGEYRPLAVVGGEAAWLAQARPRMPAIRWLDAALPGDSRTLVIGVHESYWFTHRVRSDGNSDGSRLSAYLDAPDASALHRRLLDDGFTHVAVHTASVHVGDRPATGRAAEEQTILTRRAAGLLQALLATRARPAGQGEGMSLFALVR